MTAMSASGTELEACVLQMEQSIPHSGAELVVDEKMCREKTQPLRGVGFVTLRGERKCDGGWRRGIDFH